MNNSIDLSVLKGLDLPKKPDIFPLAGGWWIIAIILLLLILILYFSVYAYLHSLRHQVWKDFNKISKIKNNQRAIKELNQLAKRLAIAHFGRKKISHLYESEWIEFMNSLLQKPIFSKKYIDLLHKNIYAKKYEISDDVRLTAFQDYKKWFKIFLKK